MGFRDVSGSGIIFDAASAGSAVDGNSTDRWTTSRAMKVGDYYQMDFTGTVKLSTITLDNTGDGSANDYPVSYAVYTSQDAVTFSGVAVSMGPGASGKTIISFPQESLRAIRIQVTTASATSW